LPAGQDGWLEVTVTERNTDRYIGFNDTNPDAEATNIDYALLLGGASLKVYENGVLKLTAPYVLQSGDVLKIARTGTAIKYYYNGTLLSYQNNAAITTALMVDVSLQGNNASLAGVRTSFGGTTRNTVRRFTYDHAGRPVNTYHSLDGAAEILLTQNEYNEIGQLVDKKLHSSNNSTSFKQSVDYRYNIRGWLTSMNNSRLFSDGVTNDDTNDLFGMDIGYNTAIGPASTPQYNGNISAIKWTSNQAKGTIKDVAYNYTYDQLNRLTAANYAVNNGGWALSTAFGEAGYNYDMNGNIRNLTRKDATGANMDVLAYTYNANQLLTVADTGDKTKGFIEPATATVGNDYNYDANGNMYIDQNKGITAIAYNHLNLPQQVAKGSEKIVYTYDATGRKLVQQVYNAGNTVTKTTDYVGEYVYENDALQFINHEEGRITKDNTSGIFSVYQYHLKDHLGNVRVTFTTKDETETVTATLEAANAATENGQFLRYANAKRINAAIFDKTNGSAAGYSERLNGSANEKYGLARSISVMAGDVISAEVYAKYVDPVSTNWSGALTTLINQIAANTAGVVIDGNGYSTSTSSFPSTYGTLVSKTDNGAPKAYLNWLIFDRNYVFVTGGFKQITTAGKEAGTDVAHELVASPTITITQPGYVYIYLSNESAAQVDVYFDDFKVTQVKSPVVESQDFYPFGLTFNKYSRENSVENRYLYNQGTGDKTFKTERITELDLNVDQSRYRTYDYLTGRWWQVDPKADQGGQESWSTYQFGFNNPIRNNDPEGDIVIVIPIAVYYAVVAVGTAVIAWQAKRTYDAAVQLHRSSNSNSTTTTKADPIAVPNSKVLPAPNSGTDQSVKDGKIYRVPGEKTQSGDPYIGRTKQASPEKRGEGATDGRDRTGAEVIDTYDSNKPGEGAYKEQKAIDNEGGVDKLDNKRNEVNKERMKELEKKYGPKNTANGNTNGQGNN
jgi:RHS repeat-associated protein